MNIMLLEAIDRVERGLVATILASEGHTYKKVGEKALYEVGGLLPLSGNIGAGCVDQEIMSRGKEAYSDRKPRIVRIDTSEPADIVFGYGTFCGGVIDVLIEPVFETQKAVYRELKERLEDRESQGEGEPLHLLHDLETGEISLSAKEPDAEENRYVETIDPPTPLYIFGATPLAFQLVKFLEEIDFRIHVIDWRESYLEKFKGFRHVRRHREIETFPDGAYVLVMSHYFEKDRDTLGLALRRNCRYVALLSSRKRRDTIFKELAAGGIPDEALRRVSSPAGIAIRSVTDPEIAVSIVAELVATRNRGARKKITGILLAAGRGERFGTNKLLVEIAGMPLIGHVLRNCIDSLLTEIVVIIGSWRDILQREIRWHFPGEKKIRFVVNEDPGRGMMSSLKAGIAALEEKSPGVMVLLADMPLVTTEVIDRLISEFELGEGIVVPECGGELRHPRILPAGLFPEFLALGDSEKGTVVLDRHRERIVRVGFEDREMFLDVDRPDDFEVVSRRLTSDLE